MPSAAGAAPFSTLSEAYAWLDSHINYERRLGEVVYDAEAFGLEDFRARLAALGDPHLGRRAVHIAGTRGKGSAALALEALLRASGLRVATYLSPHLREYRERVRIEGRPLAGERFAALLGTIASTAEASPVAPGTRRYFKTVFENLTALFFLAAREAAVDWMVVETGLGGRLDATNVLAPGPVLLTRIGLEHTHLLGDTLELIAAEKAAVLKAGGWAVAAPQSGPEAPGVFRARAREVAARLDEAPVLCPVLEVAAHADGQRVTIGFEGAPLTLDLSLFGPFQAENLANALAVLTQLRAEGAVPRAPRERLAEALAELRLPGRLERVSRSPEVFADGAHDPTGARALAQAMLAHFGAEPAGLIVGMMAEKDHDAFFRELAAWPHWAWLRVYRVASPRAAEAADLARAAAAHLGCPIKIMCELPDTLQLPRTSAEKTLRVIVTGSLYSIGAVEDWGREHGGSDQAQATAKAEQEPDH